MREFFDILPWWFWVGIFGFFILIISIAVAEANAWSEFSKEQNCKVVGYVSGSTYTPEKTGYSCDDGMMYWR